MARLMYNVKDVQEILGVGESKAYQFIRIMNEELRGKGFLTVQGKGSCCLSAGKIFRSGSRWQVGENYLTA